MPKPIKAAMVIAHNAIGTGLFTHARMLVLTAVTMSALRSNIKGTVTTPLTKAPKANKNPVAKKINKNKLSKNITNNIPQEYINYL